MKRGIQHTAISLQHRVWLLLLFISVALHTQSFSQPGPGQHRAPLFDESPAVYYETFNLPSEDTSKSRLDITFRISHKFFVFVRNPNYSAASDTTGEPTSIVRPVPKTGRDLVPILKDRNGNRWPFIARADILVELLNKAGTSVARELARTNIGAQEALQPSARTDFLQGIFSFDLPHGQYTVVFELDDLESTRQFLESSRKVTLRDFTKEPIELSDILFIEPLLEQRDEVMRFVPVNLGGDVFFGKNFDAYLEIVQNAPSGNPLSLTYSLYQLDETKRDSTFFVRDSLIFAAIQQPKVLEIERTATLYSYRIRESHTPHRHAAFLALKGEQLPQGLYQLRVSVTDGSRSQTRLHEFRVRWVNMPRALQDLDRAIDALEYIASREELTSLKSPFTRFRREKFEEFWKKRDPTPHTAFNEAMAEYYRRVDYAMENFGTVRMPDGLRTDRGRVYVLYGQPSTMERIFSPAVPPREIWTYETLKRRFIFVDEARNGNYKLAATENL